MHDSVAVITLNYNQNDYTLKCVESVLKSKYDSFKIFLIDNGSTNDNYEELREKLPVDEHLELHRIEKNVGYVGGINEGLKISAKTNPDYFLIMNNDTVLDTNAVQELLDTCIKYNSKAIVSGKVYHYDEPEKIQDLGLIYSNKKALYFNRIGLNEIDNGQYDEISERDLLDDVFWLFPSKLYKEIGGYSPYFWFNAEQADFALRAKKVGYKLIYAPTAKLWHKGSISIGGRGRNPKLAYWHTQSTLIFRYLHLSAYQFLLQFLKMCKSVTMSYFKTLNAKVKGEKSTFDYPNAKLYGLLYFIRWFFIRNKNLGQNPFN